MNEAMAILERVNALYSTAFTQLVTYTVGVVAFVGLLVPIAVALLQQRRLSEEKKLLEITIREEVAAARTELEQQIKEAATREQKRLSDELLRLEALTRGGIASTFATQAVNSGDFPSALGYYVSAIKHTASAAEEANMRRSLQAAKSIAPKIDPAKLAPQLRIPLAGLTKEAWEALQIINQNHRYDDDVNFLQLIEAQLRVGSAAAFN